MSHALTSRNDRVGELIPQLVSHLVTRLNPQRIILFGSRAKEIARPGSDIDLAVAGGKPTDFREERKLKEELDGIAGIYGVDLVFLEQTDEAFRAMVEETGKVLYEKE